MEIFEIFVSLSLIASIVVMAAALADDFLRARRVDSGQHLTMPDEETLEDDQVPVPLGPDTPYDEAA